MEIGCFFFFFLCLREEDQGEGGRDDQLVRDNLEQKGGTSRGCQEEKKDRTRGELFFFLTIATFESVFDYFYFYCYCSFMLYLVEM